MSSKFDWNSLAGKLQKDALSDGKKKFETDSRFFKLSRNDQDVGGALVRFLLDPQEVAFVKMTRIAANQGYQKRFCNEWSPNTIGKADPFNERWSHEYNAGNHEESKRFGRSIRYLTNIKVVKDPGNPANNGKIFLLDMSPSLFAKITDASEVSPDELAIDPDLKPKEVYNPLQGNNFLLKIKKGTNGIYTMEDSKFAETVDGVYGTEAEYDADIKANGYDLGKFLEPESFMTYKELEDKLAWYTGEDAKTGGNVTTDAELESAVDTVVAEVNATKPKPEATPTPAPTPAPEPTPAPKADDVDELDDLLEGL